MYHGVINVYKEAGFTSHDVVAKLRGILKQKKIGHTGTLDPAAEGVLPVCLGKGTKLVNMLTDERKTYEAVLLLGTVTDTQDTTGTVLWQQDCSCTEEEVLACLRSFRGEQLQVPPMYSAKKVGGKKLYELARAGKEVERKPVPVTFYEIEPLEVHLPEVRFRVSCSKGSYIRTLCHDVGAKLGCGGCMAKLLRTQVGRFSMEKALKLSQIEALARDGQAASCIYSVDAMFAELPSAKTDPQADAAAHNGGWIPVKQTDLQGQEAPEQIRLYDSVGDFVGIYRRSADGDSYQVLRMFYDTGDQSR